MKNIDRRQFLKNSVAGSAGLALHVSLARGGETGSKRSFPGPVRLGSSGVEVSRLAFGTGTRGWKHVSDQTKLGKKNFVSLAQHVFDNGITFFDVADIYGSHEYLKEALKQLPRDKVVIMSKMWIQPNDWMNIQAADVALDRFRKEIGVDVIDILLIHCQTDPNWVEQTSEIRDVLSRAKEKGLIRTHGVSCHSLDALKAAAESDWVEVVLGRINNVGNRMDDKPEKVMPVLKKIHDNGKGVLGMKIFGCGDLVEEKQRESSLQYVWNSRNVDAMTIGFESKEQVDDTIKRVKRILAV